jgi:putative transposase
VPQARLLGGELVVPEHTIGGNHLTRILDGICSQLGRPAMIRTDNGPEFTGKAMLTWGHIAALSHYD